AGLLAETRLPLVPQRHEGNQPHNCSHGTIRISHEENGRGTKLMPHPNVGAGTDTPQIGCAPRHLCFYRLDRAAFLPDGEYSIDICRGMPLMQLLVFRTVADVDAAAALHAFARIYFLGPANEVRVARDVQEFPGIVVPTENHVAVPGEDGHVG